MSRSIQSPITRAILCALIVAAVTFSACGRKAPPIPPPSKAPAAAEDLTAVQRGSDVLLEVAYPTVTAGGLPLAEVSKLEVYTAEGVIETALEDIDFDQFDADAEDGEAVEEEAGGGVVAGDPDDDGTPVVMMGEDGEEKVADAAEDSPGTSAGAEEGDTDDSEASPTADADEAAPALSAPKMRRNDFAPVAELVTTLEGASLTSSVVGNRIYITLPLEELDRERNQFYGVVFYTPTGLQSGHSNIPGVQPAPAPAPPTALSVTPAADGITLSWTAPEGELEGFHVYRRNANTRRYGEPLVLTTAKQRQFVDSRAAPDGRYIYTVTSVLRSIPLTESTMSAEFEVDYRDRFAPPTPANPVALTQSDQVRLLWEASDADDLAGYLIERMNAEGKISQLTAEPITAIEYTDRNIVPSTVYRYRVWSIDRTGNESEPSEWVDAPIP